MSTQDAGIDRADGRIPPETIAAALAPFHAGLTAQQIQAIQDYLSVLLQWNQSINLTAIEDPIEILARHFGESLFAASFLRIGAGRLADVGTGPGFPGLPLKIVSPGMELALFESNSKKCAFLTEVVQRLGLSRVKVMRQRYQEFRPGVSDQGFDFVCSRALGDYPVFLPWARRVLKPGGSVVLWLGTEESIRISRRQGFSWDAPVPIPESRRRVILVGRNGAGPECST
jgi:16S rRNA (guanine527-N7)-methyltransferase